MFSTERKYTHSHIFLSKTFSINESQSAQYLSYENSLSAVCFPACPIFTASLYLLLIKSATTSAIVSGLSLTKIIFSPFLTNRSKSCAPSTCTTHAPDNIASVRARFIGVRNDTSKYTKLRPRKSLYASNVPSLFIFTFAHHNVMWYFASRIRITSFITLRL